MGYLRKRLAQPSTWIGFAMAGSSLVASGGVFTPDVITMLLGALGLVHIDEQKE